MQTVNNQASEKVSALTAKESLSIAISGLFQKLRGALRGLAFWKMALYCLLLRCFVKYPFGPLLALAVGTVWCFENMDSLRRFFGNVRSKMSGSAKGQETYSLWYENGGREQISTLIATLSDQGKTFCNLTEEIKMPPSSHWFAISKELGERDIKTQISGNTFFIAWDNKMKRETA